jgi:hypothetical protein
MMPTLVTREEAEMYDDGYRRILVHQHTDRIEHAARREFELHPPRVRRMRDDGTLELRLCCVHDDAALRRLADLEGKAAPRGCYVIAKVDGVLVAAHSLDGGDLLADPYRPTEHLLPLLRLRAEQVAPAPGKAAWWHMLGAKRAVRRA